MITARESSKRPPRTPPTIPKASPVEDPLLEDVVADVGFAEGELKKLAVPIYVSHLKKLYTRRRGRNGSVACAVIAFAKHFDINC